MNKNLNHKGASKRKGAAESKELTEDGPVIDVADKGMAKKKGAAQKKQGDRVNFFEPSEKDKGPVAKGPKGFDASSYSLSANNSGKDFASSFYDADQDGDSVFNDSNQDGTMLGRGLQLIDKKVRGANQKKQGDKVNFFEPSEENKGPVAKGPKGFDASSYSLSANNSGKDFASSFYDVDQDGDSVFNDSNQDGTMLGRGLQSASNFLRGAKRTGFTQDFGAARQNGYAKGAAKVNSIMNFGAAQYGGKKGDDSKSKKDYEG